MLHGVSAVVTGASRGIGRAAAAALASAGARVFLFSRSEGHLANVAALMLRPEDVADAVLWAATRAPHVTVDELRISRA